MRIVHVVNGYLPQETGGVPIHVANLCRGLRARGHAVEVFTRLAGHEHPELSLSHNTWDGVPVTHVTNNFTDVTRFEQLYSHPTIEARFGEFLDEARPDLVHMHHLTCLSTSMIAVARQRSCPVVMSLHDYWMVCPRGQRIRPDDLEICETLDRSRCLPCLNRLWPQLLPMGGGSLVDRLRRRAPSLAKLHAWERHVRRMLALCQATITPSSFHRDRFVEWGLDPASCFCVPHGFDTTTLLAPPRAAVGPRHIGFIGTVIPSKGVHVLCDALNQLNRPDLVLHVHGDAPGFHSDTGYLDRLKQLVRPGLDVRFHGRYEHATLPALLAELDVLVVPSLWWESFCMTAYEGVLAGVPVIASRVGALGEAVDRGMALGVRPGDAGDLARVLAMVLDDPDLRDRMSRKASLVQDLDSSAQRTEEVYRFAVQRLGVASAP